MISSIEYVKDDQLFASQYAVMSSIPASVRTEPKFLVTADKHWSLFQLEASE